MGSDQQPTGYPAQKPSKRARHSPGTKTWPIWVRTLFTAVQEVPWVGVTAITALCGAALQFQYFKSIGHVPSDLGALPSLAISTSIAAVLMLLVAGTAMVLPTVVTRMYLEGGSKQDRTPFAPLEVLGAQLAGVGLYFVQVGYEKWIECKSPLPAHFYLGAVFATFGLGHLLWMTCRRPVSGSGLFRLWHIILIGISAFAPFLAVLPLQGLLSEEWADLSLLLLSLWLLLLATNAALTRPDPALGGAVVVGLGVAIMLYVLLPLGFDRVAKVSAAVAEIIGIRSNGTVTLVLSQRACEVVRAAGEHNGKRGKPLDACTRSNANIVRAKVLSNVGSRWVLGLESGGPQHDELRITVPADEVQVATSVEERRPPGFSCPAK